MSVSAGPERASPGAPTHLRDQDVHALHVGVRHVDDGRGGEGGGVYVRERPRGRNREGEAQGEAHLHVSVRHVHNGLVEGGGVSGVGGSVVKAGVLQKGRG